MRATFPHAVVEIVQNNAKVTGAVDTTGMLLKAISAGRAFHQYTWMYKAVLNFSVAF